MLSKLVAVRGASCRSLSLAPHQLSTTLNRRANTDASNSIFLRPPARYLSTSPTIGTTNRGENHQKSHYNANNRGNEAKISCIVGESKDFCKFYKSMEAAHREIKLQQLLLAWGPAIKSLNHKDSKTLRLAVEYADTLANIYLDVSMEASSSDKQVTSSFRRNTSASTYINPAIHGWAKIQRIDPHSDAAKKAEYLLNRLMEMHRSTNEYFFLPRLHTFNGVLDAFGKSASKEAPEKARELLQKMISEKDCVSPDRISFNCVLNAYAARGKAMDATALFREMKEQTSRGLQPDAYTYNMLMKAWQRSRSPKAPDATAQLVEDYKHAYKRHGKNNLFLRPNVSIYSIAMSLASAEKAHSLLDDMFNWNQREMLPQAYHYGMVMNSYAREGQPEKAEEIFMRMLQVNRDGESGVQPEFRSFCILIKAWCKQGTAEATQRAEAILKEMEVIFLKSGISTGERMNTYGYNSVMNAHVQNRNEKSAAQVQGLFDRMLRLGKEHNNPEMLPDKVSYTTLMKAWIKEQSPGYAERVEGLLMEMTELFEKDGNVAVKPDVVSYGCAIDAWSRSGEPNAIERAESLLRRMERLSEKGDYSLRPNPFCFNSIINAHSKAGNAENAESILKWMEDSYSNGNRLAKADSITYTSCIDAWARSESSEKNAVLQSQLLFVDLVEKYRQGDAECKPTPATFSGLMMALARHHSPEVARIAKENLQVMQELDVRLNVIAYNSLLKACSCTKSGKSEALVLAITSFNTMKSEGVGVDSITYNTLLHVVNKLVEDDDARQRSLEDVFSKAQEDNMVNDEIISTMEHFGLPTSMRHLIRRDDYKERDSSNRHE